MKILNTKRLSNGIDKGDNPKSLTLNSGKIVDFLQAFGPHISILYYIYVGLMYFRKNV